MISKKMIAAGLIAATTLTAVPASAHSLSFNFGGPSWHRDHHVGPARRHFRLSEQQVRRQLRQRGFRAIRFLDRRGPVYQVRAHKRGRTFFLVVSARNGDILARHRV